jgi:hypothetical protein
LDQLTTQPRHPRVYTVSPCRQRSDPDAPHVKVNAGQEFLVEWSTGHYRSTHYFALLSADYEFMLSTVTESMLEQYLNEAPPAAASPYTGPHWQKRHLGWSSNRAKGSANSLGDFIAEGKTAVLDASDPHYLERPAAFYCSNLGADRASKPDACVQAEDMTLYKYNADGYDGDLRVDYSSTTFPWILSVHR